MTFTLLTTGADNIRQVNMALAKLSIVLVLVIIAMSVVRWAFTYDRRAMEKRNRYFEWYSQTTNDPNPDRKQLLKLAKLYRRKSPISHQAVQEKLESYGHPTNTIEATMSPVQLYEIGNPLWTVGLSINAICGFHILHRLADQENVNPHDYLEAYVADVRAGETARVAYDKQEAKLK